MTVSSLRRFLSVFFAATMCIPNGATLPSQTNHGTVGLSEVRSNTSTGHDELSPEDAAFKADFEQNLMAFEAIQQQLSPAQADLLIMLGEQYGRNILLLVLDAQATPAEFDAFLTTTNPTLTKEQALKLQQQLIGILKKENLPLEVAQVFFACLEKMQAFQQVAMAQSIQEEPTQTELPTQAETPAAEHSTLSSQNEEAAADQAKKIATENHKTALRIITNMGPSKNILLYDPETEAANFEQILTVFNKNVGQNIPLAVLLKSRTAALNKLQKLGFSSEEVKKLVHENKHDIMHAILSSMPSQQHQWLLHDPKEDVAFFAAQAQKLSEEIGQEVSLDQIVAAREEILNLLEGQGISPLEEATEMIHKFAKAERSEKWKHLSAAALASCGFGVADYLLQAADTDKRVSNSAWNWLLGTVGYFKDITTATAADEQPTALSQKSQPLSWGAFLLKPVIATLDGIGKGYTATVKAGTNLATGNWKAFKPNVDFSYLKHWKKGQPGKSEWVWSKAGSWGRVCQAASLLPTAYLYKNRTLIPQLNAFAAQQADDSQDPAMAKRAEMMVSHLTNSKWLWAAALAIPTLTQEHEEVSNLTFQSILGKKTGLTAHFACSKILPLMLYAGHFYSKNRATIKSLHMLARTLIHKDTNNAMSQAGFAMVPIAEALISDPINNGLKQITPKNSVFLRSFLSNDWGARLAKIGTGSLMRSLLFQQYHNNDKSWFKVDLGKTEQIDVDANGFQLARPEVPASPKVTVLHPRIPHALGINHEEIKTITGQRVKEYALLDKDTGSVGIRAAAPEKRAITMREAWQPYAWNATKKILVKEVTIAGTASGFYVLNNHIVKLGKLAGNAVAKLGKIAGIKESTREGIGGVLESAQFVFKMGACIIQMVSETASRPGALVHDPQQLEKMLSKVMAKPEKLAAYTQHAQIEVHKMFASKLYKHILKEVLQSTWLKTTTTREAEKKSFVLTAVLTAIKLGIYTAAWLGVTTTLAEPISLGLPKDFAESFKEGLATAEASAASGEAVPA